MLRTQFKPCAIAINKEINALIDKDYMQRVDNDDKDNPEYRYVA